MKILHLMAGGGEGGAETFSTELMAALQTQYPDLVQMALVKNHALRATRLRDAGVTVNTQFWQNPILRRWRLQRLIKNFKPDIIHAWMSKAASILPPPAGTPQIGWFGGYYRLHRFKNCTAWVGCTPDIQRHLIEHTQRPQQCFALPTFAEITKAPATPRARFNTPADVPLILCLARLHPKKGLDTLLAAMTRITDAHLWIAGEGELRHTLEQQIIALKLTDRVRLLGWQTDRAALLAAADVLAVPSRYEPFGTVMVEGWMCQVPVVAAAAQGPKATIIDGENGLLVPIDDAPALAHALQQALHNKTLREKIITGGTATYAARFTRERVAAGFMQLYQQLLAEKPLAKKP